MLCASGPRDSIIFSAIGATMGASTLIVSSVEESFFCAFVVMKVCISAACDSAAFADRCLASAHAQALTLTHGAKIAKALDKMTCVILVRKIADAARVANLVAPEHLELMVAKREEAKLSAAITTAGALLLGHETPTVLGDFTAGPSHTLPTGGTGRFFSGLRVADFLRRTSFVRYDRRSLAKAAGVVAAFAGMESLDAHGRSLQVRLAKKR